MDFGEAFAQELRMYQLKAGMGVGIAFIHIPPIWICKQMRCFFSTTLFCFSQTGETLYKWTSASRALFILFPQNSRQL